MRLIDADAFIEYLGLDAEDAREINLGEVVTLEDFDRQTTAYDLDKVVERIEEAALAHAITGQQYGQDGYCDSEDREQAIKHGLDEAIEIVKAGGVNE